jgi:GNAT superfamily N-acetyltransferase
MPEESTTTVESVGADTFAASIVVTAQIYGEAMQRPPELVVQRREIMAAHVHRTGFVGVLARDGDGTVVGFGYGYHGRPGDWWHDVVTRALGRREGRDWLNDSFELAELHVHPSRHGQGIGRRVLTAVLDEAQGTTAVLSTHDRESPARQLYRSVGFVDLLTGFVFPAAAGETSSRASPI